MSAQSSEEFLLRNFRRRNKDDAAAKNNPRSSNGIHEFSNEDGEEDSDDIETKLKAAPRLFLDSSQDAGANPAEPEAAGKYEAEANEISSKKPAIEAVIARYVSAADQAGPNEGPSKRKFAQSSSENSSSDFDAHLLPPRERITFGKAFAKDGKNPVERKRFLNQPGENGKAAHGADATEPLSKRKKQIKLRRNLGDVIAPGILKSDESGLEENDFEGYDVDLEEDRIDGADGDNDEDGGDADENVHESDDEFNFDRDDVLELLKKHFSTRSFKVKLDASELAAKYLKYFCTEAIQRAGELAKLKGEEEITPSHVEAIFPHLLFDF